MKQQLLAMGLATAICGAGAAVFAGDEAAAPAPQMYSIFEERVKPAMAEAYEAAVKNMISEFQAYQIDPEKVNFKTISGPEMGYVYVTPIDDFAALDRNKAAWKKAVETIGKDKFDDIFEPVEGAIESYDWFQVARLTHACYEPADPRLKPDDVQYIHYGFYYALPGKGEELEALAVEFKELYEAKGIGTGWSIYKSISGTDLPLYVVAFPAKSELDFYKDREKIREQLGEEGRALGEQVAELVRKMEFKGGMVRRDLSYPAPETAKKHAH